MTTISCCSADTHVGLNPTAMQTGESAPRLYELRTAAERAAVNAENFVEWGTGLSLADYQAREAALDAHEWSAAAKRTWAWGAGGGATPVAACETYAGDAVVRPGAARDGNGDGNAVAGTVFLVASVFVPQQHRGRGHATAMLAAVAEWAAEQPRALGLALFSDVGERIYRRVGFDVCPPSDDLVWPAAAAAAAADGGGSSGALLAPQLVTSYDDVVAALSPAAGLPPRGGVATVVPTAAQLRWHAATSAFYLARLGIAPPPVVGAVLAGRGAVAWCADRAGAELLLLWLDVAPGDDEGAAALVGAARAAAAAAGFSRVRAWAAPPGQLPLAAVPGAARVARVGKAPMMRLLPSAVAGRRGGDGGGGEVGEWWRPQKGVWV